MNLALFDFDGTITVGDTFSPFVHFAVEPTRMLAGRVLLGPLVLGYRFGLVSASQARPVVARFGFQGASAESVRELGRRYAAEVIPSSVRRRALERVEWHKQHGDDIVVVSGGVCCGECEIFLCRNAQGGRGKSALKRTFGPGGDDAADKGVWMSIWVEDVDAVHQRCLEQGLEVTWPPTDMPWSVREMHVRHPDGHVFRIGRGIEDA